MPLQMLYVTSEQARRLALIGAMKLTLTIRSVEKIETNNPHQ
jgi:hypothetical protein